ncbi:MAG: Crp/Fnr family transcriptional regulator [Oscillospiraceae bacterium]|nr:Crp/Fnr family transcriptional regulator [Oscillospiraceae bacterium]MBQ9843875.1 Crp/Fnr family transcriptional regulator [Oscillospiraceae bacterium]
MALSEYFPIYDKLTKEQQALLDAHASMRTVPPGTILHNGDTTCMGLLIIRDGQLRAYMTSDEGREITLYRLFARDICLFSASCIMNSIQFEITITAEKETEFWIIPPYLYKNLMDNSLAVSNYTNQIMATRFTDVMWLVEQIQWKSFDKRLAHFLLEESSIEQTTVLKITHEKIAAHLGTAREVVTRMLKYFQAEDMVLLTRGTIEIIGEDKLEQLAED